MLSLDMVSPPSPCLRKICLVWMRPSVLSAAETKSGRPMLSERQRGGPKDGALKQPIDASSQSPFEPPHVCLRQVCVTIADSLTLSRPPGTDQPLHKQFQTKEPPLTTLSRSRQARGKGPTTPTAKSKVLSANGKTPVASCRRGGS